VDAIVVEGLRKRYREVQALDGVSFSVGGGEIVGLLGPNGAGKSTTVRILATLTSFDEGRAEVAGHDVQRDPGAVRGAIGYVPQDSGVDREATGRENLMLQGRIQGMRGSALRARAEELLTGLDILHAADRPARTYSGGMRRRLDVALGLIHRPRVLFLDEPTTGLDPEARAALWEELERLARDEELTILLTTHYLEEADRLASRVVIVSQGAVVVEGTPERLKQALRGDSVTIELDAGDGDRGWTALDALSEVHQVVLDGRQLRVVVDDGARAVATIVSALDASAVPILSVTIARPSLDEVYLHYTGRDFRSEDAAAIAARAPAERSGRGR
jgi:ABC-2 type transport system ATP-binding protein